MKKNYQLRDRATQPQKATQASEPLSEGAMEATQATQDKPPCFTRISTVHEAVQHSLKDGLTEDSLFTFARALKAFAMTHDRRLPAPELGHAFSLWWSTATPLLPAGASHDEYRLTFLDAFARARTPLGSNSVTLAIERAATSPLPPQAAKFTDPRLRQLVAVMFQLQQMNGDAPFFLGVRHAAEILGTTNKTRAANLLRGLVLDGTLEVIESGKPGGKRATRYHLNASGITPPES
jgi:hypothetical protein